MGASKKRLPSLSTIFPPVKVLYRKSALGAKRVSVLTTIRSKVKLLNITQRAGLLWQMLPQWIRGGRHPGQNSDVSLSLSSFYSYRLHDTDFLMSTLLRVALTVIVKHQNSAEI